ncbi:MAG: carbohydrate binding domain-containing protein, partial [Patescibacteria group bacterium]
QALSAGAWQILPSALSTFTNVLISNFTKRIFEGLFSDETDDANPFDVNAEAGGTDKETVKAQFTYLLTPTITDSGAYDVVTEFTVCPEQFKNVNNCVIDTGLATAINQARTGAPLTVGEALAQGFINPDLPLISQNNPANGDPYCFRKGYCYSNLAKLRRYRIIPIGWEFAAAKSQVDKPATLGQAVKGFNQCNQDGEADEKNPWCHLIDPNWVLKYPSTECRAKVSGETLVSADAPERNDVCVDAPSCVAENDKGKCVGGWGYCTREKNAWKIGGDECPSYYNSCQTLTRVIDSANVDLLKNTLDYGVCSAENVGCRWYSRGKNLASNEWQNSNPVYLNRQAEKCDAASAGCSALIKKGDNIRANLVVNSSFEKGGATPDYWDGTPSEYDTATANSFHSSRAVKIASGSAGLENNIPIQLEPDTVYNLSVYAKNSSGDGKGEVSLSFASLSNIAGWSVLGDCVKSGNKMTLEFTANETYGRADCSFVTDEDLKPKDNAATISLKTAGGEIWFDAVMLSEGPFSQDYLESGYGDEVPRSYLKKPPAWLGCTGAETDNPGCKNYARVCGKSEAGCELWTPTNGDPSVPAVTNANDVCPRECIGYETWRQEKTNFESPAFPLYFIPDTAKKCGANVAGCDEFTNVETAAAGGEAREYFVDFRRCMKSDPSKEATYYTWEGSGVSGYQLKSFVLKKGDAISGRAPEEFGEPPAYQNGFTDFAACDKTIFSARINPDCREFYDATGNISYRLYSKTILSTPDCKEYRKTEGTEADCVTGGGVWDAGAATCTYSGYKPESAICGAPAKGCRAYVGNTGRNVREVFADNMEKPPVAGIWEGVVLSTESTVAGGHSYSISSGDGFYASSTPGATYVLSVWARGTGNLNISISGQNLDANVPQPQPVILSTNWKLYNFGPIRVADGHNSSWQDKLTFTTTASPVYIDNVSLREVNQNLYLIKDTWRTPASCDQTQAGTELPQAMLGCKEYKNRAAEPFAYKSFNKICREASVGCAALVDTKNSANISAETWNAVCPRPSTGDGSALTESFACSYNNRPACVVPPGEGDCFFNTLGVPELPANKY